MVAEPCGHHRVPIGSSQLAGQDPRGKAVLGELCRCVIGWDNCNSRECMENVLGPGRNPGPQESINPLAARRGGDILLDMRFQALVWCLDSLLPAPLEQSIIPTV
jgi:hypothetical protein